MNVCIFTEVGINIGYGHIVRCVSLFQAFQMKGIVPTLIINSNIDLSEYLVPSKSYVLLDWLSQLNKTLVIAASSDIVVIDSYLAPSRLCQKISEAAKLAVYLDDFRRIEYPKGIIVNSSIHAPELPYPKREEIIYVLGLKYILLRKEFWDRQQKIINDNVKNIFLSFGGDDRRNLTPITMKLLTKHYPDFIKTIIIGKGFTNIKEIDRLKDDNTRLLYNPDAMTIKNEMLLADIAITPNGQTLYELARIGVPTIAVAVSARQLASIRLWNKKGFTEYGGIFTDAHFQDRLLAGIESMQEKKIRVKKSKIGRALVDGKGAERITDLLIKMVKKGHSN